MSLTQLPPVGWVFIHQLTLLVPGGDFVTDAEGRWSEPVETPVPVRGYLALTGRAELELANALGVRIDAVAAFARDVEVTEQMRLLASGIDPYLDGEYRITAVRPTPVHVRALLVRTLGHEDA